MINIIKKIITFNVKLYNDITKYTYNILIINFKKLFT